MRADHVHEPGDNRRGFLFLTCGSFSGVNASVLPLLERSFSELEPNHFDVADWTHAHRPLFAANVAAAIAESGPRALLGRRSRHESFYRTSFIQSRISQAMRKRASAHPCGFSLQTQSMFDGSVPGLPHFVYTDHTALANTYYPGFDRRDLPPKRWLARERAIYKHATLNFTWSGHVSRSMVEHYGIDPARVRCVFAGANVDAGDRGPGGAGKQILFVGRDWERKGGPNLEAAFSLVRRQHPDAELVICGDSPQIETEGVTVLGEASMEAIGELYRQSAAVLCMPTRVEPFGIVFVEALAHGLPVVASSIGALPDIVQDGETGLLVPPDDPSSLAEALDGLLSNPEMARRFGELGRRRMRERFTWPQVVDSMASQIREAVATA